jgi:hypothetical protein
MNLPEVSIFDVDSWQCCFISLENRMREGRKVMESLGDGVILDHAG